MRQSPSSPADSRRTLRIVSVVAATCIALSCGTNYAYSAWGPQFASRLELSATQANLIGNAGNIGMYAMGIPGGILIDSRGPRWGVLLGCLSLACGYFPLRAAYLGGPGSFGMPALCLFGLLTGMGSCTAFSASLKVCATNWPKHRGTATAFPLSAFGLSAFFYTALASWAFPHDTAGYLGLLAGGTTAMVFVGMFFLQIIRPASPYEALPTEEAPGLSRRDSNRMRRTSSSHKRSDDEEPAVEQGKSSILSSNDTRSPFLHGSVDTVDETSSLVSSPTTSLPGDIAADSKPPNADGHNKPDITGFALLRSVKFYQLWILLALLCGTGLMTINNIGNNARSLWHHWDPSAGHDFIQRRQLIHVSIISLGSFLGRLGSGIGSDWLIHHHASRFWTLVVSACLFTIAQMVGLGLEDPNHLYWLSALTGLAYGALFGVYPALVADAFGPSGMGINWGAMTMAPVLSGNVFNLAYGGILDGHSHYEDDGNGGRERVCSDGRICYSSAYWITLLASVVGVIWSVWCIRQDKLQRLREERERTPRAHEG